MARRGTDSTDAMLDTIHRLCQELRIPGEPSAVTPVTRASAAGATSRSRTEHIRSHDAISSAAAAASAVNNVTISSSIRMEADDFKFQEPVYEKQNFRIRHDGKELVRRGRADDCGIVYLNKHLSPGRRLALQVVQSDASTPDSWTPGSGMLFGLTVCSTHCTQMVAQHVSDPCCFSKEQDFTMNITNQYCEVGHVLIFEWKENNLFRWLVSDERYVSGPLGGPETESGGTHVCGKEGLSLSPAHEHPLH